MNTTPARVPRPSPAFRLVAVAALFTFGCTVVRAPASGMNEVIPVRDGRAEPQLALWVEGGAPVTPEQSQQAATRARAALSEASEGLQAPEDGLLVIRAQGLTRTGQRKSDQTAAVVGIAVGIVVIVAVVVLVLVAEAKGGGGGGGKVPGVAAAPKPHGGAAPKVAPAAHGGGAATKVATGTGVRVAPVPRGGGGGIRPAPVPGVPRVHPVPVPYTPVSHGGVVVYGGIDVNLWSPWYPCCQYWGPYPYGYPITTTETTTVWTAPPAATDVAPYAPALAMGEEDELAADYEDAEPEPPRPVEQLQLGEVKPLPVAERGFFDGDDMVIELVVVDRMTGEPKLRKVARRAIDPCDVKAVRQLLQETLNKGTWERLAPSSS